MQAFSSKVGVLQQLVLLPPHDAPGDEIWDPGHRVG